MSLREMWEDPVFVSVVSLVTGIAGTLIARQIANRRSVLSYTVHHAPVGLSSTDPRLGTFAVMWNGNEMPNVYVSTIVLTNESSSDLTNFTLAAFSQNTRMLNEKTQIIGSSAGVLWTENYQKATAIAEGSQATKEQLELVTSRREYLVPVLNRGQQVQLEIVTTAEAGKGPTIWLDVPKEGVRLRFQPPREKFGGVDRGSAILAGMISIVLAGIWLARSVSTPWILVTVAMVLGVLVLVPGVVIVRAYQKLRSFLRG